ncbi:SpoIIE family protein phosphatase [Rubritalea tangerina]|uniref:SpoIIE family protein phosphatase n=3 Tax=Rubritalea tangerina TaxID=430798 RepID=A0ABW4Z648_9BACT
MNFLFWLSIASLILLGGYIVLHESRTRYAAVRDTAHYGELLSSYLWNIDEETAQEYTAIIATEGEFKSISVTHSDGALFANYREAKNKGEIREFLRSMGLIRDIENTQAIFYRGKRIGDITTLKENTNIYTYFYLLLTILLIIASMTLIRVGKANKEHQIHLEHDLSENRERLQTVVSASPVIAFSLDRHGKFTVCEGMGLNKLHEKPMDIIGKSIEAVHNDMPTNVGDFLRALKGESFSEIRTTEGRSFETWYSPMREGTNIVGVIGVSTDVTAAIQAMNSLNDYKRSQAKDLQIAQRAHQAFLPKSPPELSGFEIGFITKPCASIGGDYIHFDTCSNHQKLGITFAEMSGHGVSSSLLASIFHTQLEDCINIETPSIADAFYQINLRVHELFPEGRFASTFHTILNAEENTMRFVKAAREPAVLFRHDGNSEIFDKGGPALGLLPSELLNKKSYIEHSIPLNQGDTLFLYSDGLVEVENTAGVMIERKEIIDWVRQDLKLSPQQIADSLYRKVISHASGGDIVDDISILVIRKL